MARKSSALPRLSFSAIRVWAERHARWIVVAFFACTLLTGVSLHRQYGIPWDELYQQDYGRAVYDYVFLGDKGLLGHHEKYHGPAVEFALTAAKRTAGLIDARDVHFLRHLGTFLLFWTGSVFLYLLARRLFKDWKPALLTAALLILSPRIVTDAFYNTKDIPLMALFTVSMYTLVRFIDKKTPGRAAAHALACALAIDTRIVGVFVPILTLLWLLYDLVRERKNEGLVRPLGMLCGWLAGTVFLTILFWPVLWLDPVGQFVAAFERMGKYPWGQDVFYLGKYVSSSELPWHYLPVWIAVTTPVLYTALFLWGGATVLWAAVRRPFRALREMRAEITVLLWFFVPVIAVIVGKSVVYDGWRHVFFIYPALLLLAVLGLRSAVSCLGRILGDARLAATLLGIVVAVSCAGTMSFLIRNHPYGNLYFSWLTGGIAGADGRFELDYWGLSYRQAIEMLLRTDKSERIALSMENDPGRLNAEALDEQDRARVELTDRDKATYHLTNHRWHYAERAAKSPVVSVRVDGVEILGVYKLREPR